MITMMQFDMTFGFDKNKCGVIPMRSRASRWLHILNASLNQTYRQIVYTSTRHQPNYHLINPDGNFLFKGNLFNMTAMVLWDFG